MAHPLKNVWDTLVASIARHRDRRARFYKPTCIIATSLLVKEGAITPEYIPPAQVIERFRTFVQPLFPSSAERGWLPFWHLMTDRAWICYQGSEQVKRTVFRAGKPKSLRQLLTHVEYATVPKEMIGAWRNPEAIADLQQRMITLLREEFDVASQAVGEYFQCRFNRAEARASVSGEALVDEALFSETHYLEDYSRFRAHIVIERNKRLADAVKQAHGYSCELCGFNFERAYGKIGCQYIEAHHLTPVSARKGTIAELNPKRDFAVLCANCHRMMHRSNSPGDLRQFRNAHRVPVSTQSG